MEKVFECVFISLIVLNSCCTCVFVACCCSCVNFMASVRPCMMPRNSSGASLDIF